MPNRQSYHSTAAGVKAAAADSWLREVVGDYQCAPMPGDAGHRGYFRICGGGDKKGARGGYVLMTDNAAGVNAFLRMRGFFAEAMTVPNIIAARGGLCLLEDFGDDWYLRARNNKNIAALYNAAIRALTKAQTLTPPPFLCHYDDAMLRREMLLFDGWYVRRHLQQTITASARKMLADARGFLCAQMLQQGQVPVHRDYHSRNLMVIGKRSPGVLDFQDAVCGSPFYDMASLLRDAYTYWRIDEQKTMLRYYLRHAKKSGIKLPQSFDESWQMFNIASAQRGLKVLGIFARLALRDNKLGFLRPMPLARRHLLSACDELPQLAKLGQYVRALPKL